MKAVAESVVLGYILTLSDVVVFTNSRARLDSRKALTLCNF